MKIHVTVDEFTKGICTTRESWACKISNSVLNVFVDYF